MRPLLVFGLLLSRVAIAGDPFDRIPEVVSSIPIEGELAANGVPVRARAVITKLSYPALLKHLEKRMHEESLYIPPPHVQFEMRGMPQLTGYDGVTKKSYTAIFRQNPDRTLTVILGVADLSEAPQKLLASSTSEVPVMPSAQQAVQSQDEGRVVVTYSVQASPSEVERYYQASLKQAGLERLPGESAWAGKPGRLELSTVTLGGDAGTQVVAVWRRASGSP